MKYCEIFRTGVYKDAEGNDISYTEADLDTMVKKFMEAENPMVPIVVGHPKDNSPAFGWVESLKREGGKLYAAFKDVAQEFAEAVNNGRYKNRSISHYPDLMLRHIGFLGAMPPKVKGMEPFTFSDDNKDVIMLEFSESESPAIKGFKFIKNLFSEKFDIKDDGEIIIPYGIKPEESKREAGAGADGSYPRSTMANFAEELTIRDEKIKELEIQINELNKKSRKKEFENFAENLINNGNITPAIKSFVIDFMEICHNQNTYDFSEGEEKSVETRFKDFLKSLKIVNFSEVVNKNNYDDLTVDFNDANAVGIAIQAVIKKEKEKGKEISAKEALNILERTQNANI